MANSRKNFSKIYDQYVNKIYRFVFLKVNSQEIAEDLTSETFLRGWESFKGNQNRVENPSAFLYKIARNLITDFYREKGKTKIVPAENIRIIDPNQNLEEKAILNSDLNNIRLALINLSEDYQNVVIWHYLDDFSIQEVAKMLDKSEEATRVLLHRALKALRNELK